jgi:hypothetical protein
MSTAQCLDVLMLFRIAHHINQVDLTSGHKGHEQWKFQAINQYLDERKWKATLYELSGMTMFLSSKET